MANWKELRIIDKHVSSDCIRFELNGRLSYSDGSKNFIWLKKTLPFTEWKKDDEVNIDTEKTCKYEASHDFTFYENTIYKSSTSTSTALVRVQSDYSSLQSTNTSLQTRKRELELEKARLDERNTSLYSENSSLRGQIEWGKGEIVKRDTRITEYSAQLTAAQNQLTTTRNDLVAKQNQYDELMRQFTALQITINNKDNEIKEKVDKIKELKGELNLSQEEFLNQKIGLKDEKLETFIQTLGINRGEITSLRSAYEQLIIARRDYVQANIVEARNNINAIRGRILNGGVSVANTQKVCRKCEKLVKLELDLNEIYQQQYEARQEAPPRNNN